MYLAGVHGPPGRHDPPAPWTDDPSAHVGRQLSLSPSARSQDAPAPRFAASWSRVSRSTTAAPRSRATAALFATLSPGGTRGRKRATVSFELAHPCSRRAAGACPERSAGEGAVDRRQLGVVAERAAQRAVEAAAAGRHKLIWEPPASLPPGTYTLQLLVTGVTGKRTVYGTATPVHPHLSRAPIVRVLGLDAAFLQSSYAPGDAMTMFVAADAQALTVQLFQSGPETDSDVRKQPAERGAGRRPAADRLAPERRRAGADQPDAPVRRSRAASTTRACSRATAGSAMRRSSCIRRRPPPGRGDHADEHLARLQLLRRRRRRLRRQLVRLVGDQLGRRDAAAPEPRGARTSTAATTSRSCTGSRAPASRRISTPTRISSDLRAATRCAARTT